jgi:sarcosine oxidase subunit alpha
VIPSRRPRLPPPYGLLIDRARPLSFRFEGRTIEGFAGDTLASAILANGIAVPSWSFKYHRPRGPLSLAGQDANVLVQLPGEPNVPADRRAAADGLEVSAQHCTGGLFADRERWIERFARFLPVGFYYKAFYRPRGAWDRWEPFIRRKAGLGRVARDIGAGMRSPDPSKPTS